MDRNHKVAHEDFHCDLDPCTGFTHTLTLVHCEVVQSKCEGMEEIRAKNLQFSACNELQEQIFYLFISFLFTKSHK